MNLEFIQLKWILLLQDKSEHSVLAKEVHVHENIKIYVQIQNMPDTCNTLYR